MGPCCWTRVVGVRRRLGVVVGVRSRWVTCCPGSGVDAGGFIRFEVTRRHKALGRVRTAPQLDELAQGTVRPATQTGSADHPAPRPQTSARRVVAGPATYGLLIGRLNRSHRVFYRAASDVIRIVAITRRNNACR